MPDNLVPIQERELTDLLERKTANGSLPAGNGIKPITNGLTWPRLFSEGDPYSQINWETRTAKITKGSGEVVFEQKDVEVPSFWSQTATDIVASKYFRGRLNTPEREYSARQMVDRVADTISSWGYNGNYFKTPEDYLNFRDDLKYLLINQYAAFNSPVWFNVGVRERPQCSACQPYHALVSTPFGFYKIGEIVENNLIGLPVYDSSGITRVVAVKNNGTKKVYKIILRNGSFIEATGDHLVKAVYERRTRPAWIRVDQLKKGLRLQLYPHYRIFEENAFLPAGHFQQIAASFNNGTPDYGAPATELNNNAFLQNEISEAALAGWLQADGFVGQYTHGTNNSLTIEFLAINEAEKKWIESHLDIVFPSIHRKTRLTKTKAGTPITRICLYGKGLRDFIEKYDLLKRKTEIRAPDILWKSQPEIISAYLKSVFQGEGYVSIRKKSVHVAMATISGEWMKDLQILLYGLGIYSRIRFKKEKRENRFDLYELDISVGSERMKFAKMIGFIGENKQYKLLKSLQIQGQKNIGNLREEEVVDIQELKEEIVYDIQTTSGEYLTNNIAVHNCFILSIEDSMQSILDWYRDEGWIFKYGSGSGGNLSKLRSSKEPLSKGGFSSGPVSFMKGADGVANSIRSGGTTRRAAKMVILNADHPDIKDFIYCKKYIEEMTRILETSGIKASIEGELFNPYTLLPYQNANNSVRVTNEFMKKVETDEDWDLKAVVTGKTLERLKAREVMGWITDAAWHSADPGMQFDTIINDWHTVPNSGRINASNPCFTGDTLIYTDKGLIPFKELHEKFNKGEDIKIYTHDITNKEKPADTISLTKPVNVMTTGMNPIYKIAFSNGMEIKATKNHKFWTQNRGYVEVQNLNAKDEIKILDKELNFDRTSLEIEADLNKIYFSALGKNRFEKLNFPNIWTAPFSEYIGYLVGDGCISEAKKSNHFLSTASVIFAGLEANELLPRFQMILEGIGVLPQVANMPNGTVQLRANRTPFVRFLKELGLSSERAHLKYVPNSIFKAPKHIIAGFLRGLFSADGCVYDGYKSRYVGFGSASKKLAQDVQQLLLSFGITGSIYETRRDRLAFSYTNKEGVEKKYFSKQLYDFRIAGYSILLFKEKIGFINSEKQAKLNNLIKNHSFYEKDHGFVNLVSKELIGNELTYNLTEPSNHSYFANGAIVSNCSEYMSLDNSACNLSSINLLKFLNPDGSYDIDNYKRAINIMTTAQEIIVGNSSYPTEKITQNAMDFRQLGLGYANLGALLMNMGFAYDSDEGRAIAAALTSILCGEAYAMSAKLASIVGSFAGYEKNREPMLRVIRKHASEAANLANKSNQIMNSLGNGHAIGHVNNYAQNWQDKLMMEAVNVWGEALDWGEKYGFRNSQATVLAPTGTIAFLMDCQTTGIEPELALVKYKKLVGGGVLKLVNNQVPTVLAKLGYDEKQIQEILTYILDRETIEGAPYIKSEHLPVFDCSFKAQNGERSINYLGHIRMMSAVQPFISGAISKTVNLPNEATKDDIREAFMQAWRYGLKAIAVYRDGSKSVQPLNTSDTDKKLIEKVNGYTRIKLPDERPSITHKFSVGNHEGYLTVGMYPETKKPGETFITIAKEGSTISGLLDVVASLISMLLQSGMPLKTLVGKFKDMRFEPSGITSNSNIPFAKSFIDYIFRYLGYKFLPAEEQEEIFGHVAQNAIGGIENNGSGAPAASMAVSWEEDKSKNANTDAPLCEKCGSMMFRAGSCYTCSNCFATTGVCN